jgi:mRNA interferase MazF
MPQRYQPERGDFIFLSFEPRAGTEMGGTRSALVLSPRAFNVATGLVMVCPITNQVKGGSFEVAIPRGVKVIGVVLSDQIGTKDWLERRARFIAKAPRDLLGEVQARIDAILFEDYS